MTCLGVVLTTRTYLPMWSCDGYGGETIVQRRHGTDDMENLFCKSRGGNANANSKDTNHNVSGNISGCMNSLAFSQRRTKCFMVMDTNLCIALPYKIFST